MLIEGLTPSACLGLERECLCVNLAMIAYLIELGFRNPRSKASNSLISSASSPHFSDEDLVFSGCLFACLVF